MRRLFNNRSVLVAILVIAAFLRLWHIDQVPVSLMADELDLGYQTYSFLKTGKDYFGNPYPIHFQSFPEWKSPLYIYSSIPTVALFGISPLGVRLPAAIFGILSVLFFYLLILSITNKWKLAALGALLLAVSPWHIQYSRSGFEVMEMFVLYLGGLYFFLRSLKDGKWLILSSVLLAFTPWAYSTAKLFLPITVLLLVFIWRKQLLRLPRSQLIRSAVAFFIVITPITFSTIFGGGDVRFNYISVFKDPTVAAQVDFLRLEDSRMRSDGQTNIGVQTSLADKLFHNKVAYTGGVIIDNYLQAFSTNFLFVEGDANLRHSPKGIGQFYKFDIIFVFVGLAFFFQKNIDKKIKIFIILWIVLSPIPAALTRDGGAHATRSIFLLPPLLFFISLGVYYSWEYFKRGWARALFVVVYFGVLLTSVIFYQHTYWVHYPWDSERWWHAGWEEAIKTAVAEGKNYDKVVVSQKADPPLIFFLAWSKYDPALLQKSYPLEEVKLKGFNKVTRLGKYYFGETDGSLSPDGIIDVDEIGQLLDKDTLYVASEREVKVDLIHNPDRKPKDLVILKSVAYPSGDPAFYLFAKAVK